MLIFGALIGSQRGTLGYGISYTYLPLKVHKNENFFGFDFEFCTISLLFMLKY
jgi:hypothetical protein